MMMQRKEEKKVIFVEIVEFTTGAEANITRKLMRKKKKDLDSTAAEMGQAVTKEKKEEKSNRPRKKKGFTYSKSS